MVQIDKLVRDEVTRDEVTALGDNVNIAARLASKTASKTASKAGVGEVLVSEAASNAAGIMTEGLEKRELELKNASSL